MWGAGELEIDLALDRLNIRICDVHKSDFEAFVRDLSRFEELGTINLRWENKKGAKDYFYNLHVGQGDGAVYVGYRHNSVNPKLARERFDMKLELNPNKHDWEKYKSFWICMSDFRGLRKGVKSIDLAFDIDRPISRIVPVSTTGKDPNKIRGTFYFGQRGSHGFVRIYDKAKEEGLEGVDKTRVEFTICFEDPVTLQVFKSISEYGVFEDYIISVVDFDKFDAEMACVLFGIQHGFRSLKDFSRRKQEKIKKALLETERIEFQSIFERRKSEIVDMVKRVMNFEWYDKQKAINSIPESVPF